VAESAAAVEVEHPGGVTELYFPLGDVRLDRFGAEGRVRESSVLGPARLWSIDAPATGPMPAAEPAWGARESSELHGRDILWSHTAPPAGLGWLRGYAAFDHDRIRVELVDEEPGDDPRAVSVKRFPVWGEAAHLTDILDVRPEGPGSFLGVARTTARRPVVEGSQMLGQAMVAAGRHAPGRRVVSGHMVFFRGADARHPLRFDLADLSAGRTFSTVSVRVTQGDRTCAGGTLLLDVTAPDVTRHSAAPPSVPGPYECDPYDMSVMGRDVRVVDNAYTDDPRAPVGPPEIDAWVRFRHVPDDPCLHAGLLAQFTGHMSIAAALRAHAGIGQRDAHRTLSTAINAIGISVHGDIRADRWMLYHHDSTFAGDGMTHSACRVHDEDGKMLASFTVDAMVRGFAGSGPVDDRNAM
jgi:acyl-CoA thioesterase